MKTGFYRWALFFCFLFFMLLSFDGLKSESTVVSNQIEFYEVDPQKQTLQFFWQDSEGVNYQNFQNIKSAVQKKGRNLLFAMNGGMYLKDLSPQGLYAEDGRLLKDVNRKKNDYGNFYMEPNGIFLVTKEGKPVVMQTGEFEWSDEVNYATQSGPMLVINGKIHTKFRQGSNSLYIRNGVGVLANGNVIFAISKIPINFYDFASFFKEKGCKNALYLDGFVSRMYLPSKNWRAMDKSTFGVIIGVIE